MFVSNYNSSSKFKLKSLSLSRGSSQQENGSFDVKSEPNPVLQSWAVTPETKVSFSFQGRVA